MNYTEINKDIVNLIVNSNEKFFVLIGENSSGKSEVLNELDKLGLFTIDNFRFYDENAIKQIEDNLESENKVIIATHDVCEMFNVLCVPDTSIIIATFIDDIYGLASWGDMNKYLIYNMLQIRENKIDQLLYKLLSISLFHYWSDISQFYFNTINENVLSASQKIIYETILNILNN